MGRFGDSFRAAPGAGCTSTRIPVTSGSRSRIRINNCGASCFSLLATAALSAETTSVPARKLLTRAASDKRARGCTRRAVVAVPPGVVPRGTAPLSSSSGGEDFADLVRGHGDVARETMNIILVSGRLGQGANDHSRLAAAYPAGGVGALVIRRGAGGNAPLPDPAVRRREQSPLPADAAPLRPAASRTRRTSPTCART